MHTVGVVSWRIIFERLSSRIFNSKRKEEKFLYDISTYRLACSFLEADSLKLYITIIFTKDFFNRHREREKLSLNVLKVSFSFRAF